MHGSQYQDPGGQKTHFPLGVDGVGVRWGCGQKGAVFKVAYNDGLDVLTGHATPSFVSALSYNVDIHGGGRPRQCASM